MCKKIGQNLSCGAWKMALRIIEERKVISKDVLFS